jgi:BirA family transcriptional regulator, biotin operon repressor / biotin---[acetyl-CoA-carboxylase] ligase
MWDDTSSTVAPPSTNYGADHYPVTVGGVYTDLDRPPLRVAPLRRALVRDGALWTEVEVRARTGSTNADVLAAARAGAPEGLVVVAEEQVAGRGRSGRVWASPPRAGLTFSVLLRPAGVPSERWGWLPLLTGVALARAIGTASGVAARLKWPNDLLLGAALRKGAGILAEVADPARDAPALVVGVGLNVTTTTDELPRADATSLMLEGATGTDRDPLLRAMLRELALDYDTWRLHAGDPVASGLRAAYLESCVTLGHGVRVELPARTGSGGTSLLGRAVDIDADGRLMVDADGTVHAVAAGDVVHVRPD